MKRCVFALAALVLGCLSQAANDQYDSLVQTGSWPNPNVQNEPMIMPVQHVQAQTPVSVLMVQDQNPSAAPTSQLTSAPAVCEGNACCTTEKHHGRLIADVYAMVLEPSWTNNPAFITTVDARRQTDFGFDMQFVPKISLGWLSGDGYGFRTTWWGFAEGATRVGLDPNGILFSALPLGIGIADIAPGNTLVARAHLAMNVWDAEAIDLLESGCWSFLFAGGLRYAHVAQRYDATEFLGTSTEIESSMSSGHSFNGFGPTVALETRYTIGGGGLYLLGNVRGSLLFGKRTQVAFAESEIVSPLEGALGNGVGDSSKVVLPVGELELGVGYRSPAERRVGLVVETSLIAQEWIGAGNSSRSQPDFKSNSDVDIPGGATNDNLGLFGFSVKAGINW
jgi:hypothetical protein